MPTALTSGRQALPPSVPTLPVPNSRTPQGQHPPLAPWPAAKPICTYGPAYYQDRLKSLGLTTEEATTYGLSMSEAGHIQQQVRRFDGSSIEFIPKHLQKRVDRLLNHRSSYQPHLEMFYHELMVTRLHPDYLKNNPEKHKYHNQYGEKVRPLPAPHAINAYNNRTLGGVIAFIEGYFKAIALDLAGIEAIAFTGITVYRIDPDLRDYLLRRLPTRILIMYDADALDVRSGFSPTFKVAKGESPTSKPLSSKRNQDFANSAANFAAALFNLFASIGHTCEIVFVMGKPSSEQKGVDDLIEANSPSEVAEDLLNFDFTPRFRESRFFAGYTLAPTTFRRKLNRLFLGNNYRDWYERLPTSAGSNINSPGCRESRSGSLCPGISNTHPGPFSYRQANYQPISHGDLYNPTTTYELLTDPFKADHPTDYLHVNTYLTDKEKELFNLIETHKRLAIQAPTGSGKTTFLTKLSRRQKTPMVVVVPYVNLAKQIARDARGFLLIGTRSIKHIRESVNHNLVVCTYDTLHQLPDLWRRILVVDEAHNLINQYGQVYNGFKPFRAETLRACVSRFHQATKVILLSGTMPPLLCHALDFHLVTFLRKRNPKVRVCDVEAKGSDATALAKCLLTRLAELFPRPQRGQTAVAQGASDGVAGDGTLGSAATVAGDGTLGSAATVAGDGTLGSAATVAGDGTLGSAATAAGTGTLGPAAAVAGYNTMGPAATAAGNGTLGPTAHLHTVFWNNTDQITQLKTTLIKLGYLKESEIAIVSRTHYNEGQSPTLDDIITKQQINPNIRLLLCTCLISEGLNIRNKNVGHLFTVNLRCEDTFRQFIARFRKLKTVSVYSILPAERDLHPDFFRSAKLELLENLECARLQATHLQRRKETYHTDYTTEELPFLDQIEKTQNYTYQNQLLNLVYHDGDWQPDPLHVLAAIRGRKLATGNNCYFYTRLRDHGYDVYRVQQQPINHQVDTTIDIQQEINREDQSKFREDFLVQLSVDPVEPINALFLIYQEADNRHGLQSLRKLVPDLLDEEHSGATAAHYLARHRHHLDTHAIKRILRFAKLHALGVADKSPFLTLSDADFNHEYRAALFHFEQLVANDPEHRKLLQPAHKEEIRIKRHIVATLTAPAPVLTGFSPSSRPIPQPLTGKQLLERLTPLFAVPRPDHLPPPELPAYGKRQARPRPLFSFLALTPAKAVNLVRHILHASVTGHGRYRAIHIGQPFTAAHPPPLAAVATKLITSPEAVLQLLDT